MSAAHQNPRLGLPSATPSANPWRTIALAALFAAATADGAAHAHAPSQPQPTQTPPSTAHLGTEPSNEVPGNEVPGNEVPGNEVLDYWEGQRDRAFVAGDLRLGAYNSARIAAGYGRPNWMWVGIDGQVAATLQFVALETTLNIRLLAINAAFGLRQLWTYSRRRPVRADRYDDGAIEDVRQPISRYGALHGTVWGFLPAGPVLAYWELAGQYLPDVTSRHAIFSEFFRYTANSSTVAMVRGALWYRLLDSRLLVGPAIDSAFDADRPAVVRVGLGGGYRFSDHLALRLLMTIPVVSPDSMSWFTQSWGAAVLAYTWASDEPNPGLP